MTAHSKPRAARAKYPKHDVTYEVREAVLEASPQLAKRLHGWLDVLCELRETLRRHRADDRDTGRQVRAAGGSHRYATKADHYKLIAELASRSIALRAVHSQVRQDVADRIERATKEWLKGERGPVRYKPRRDYRSFTFTQYGSAAKIRSGRLHLSGLGEARLIGMRKLPGRVKSVTLTFKQGRWFAQFTCEVQVQHSERERRHASDEAKALPDTGLDTGLARVATLADGTVFTPARPLKAALPRLRKAQRRMSRQFEARKRELGRYKAEFEAQGFHGPLPEKNLAPLSNRLKRQIRRVAVLHTKVDNTRRDSLRKAARLIEQRYRLVAVEEHSVEFMRKNRRQARAVSDVAPGLFKTLLKDTLGADRYVPVGTSRPDIGGNSQTCVCGAPVRKELTDRWHDCKACGLSADRDAVSANIAMLIAFGYSNLGAATPPEPGQGFVRRGEGKGLAGKPVTAASARTTEPPVKRPSSRGRPQMHDTASAEKLLPQPKTRRSSDPPRSLSS